ncbi:High_cysteine membrane protein [Hexamita inflata]|uniref:High cysteine membrane protein n=1 Tax=Hexamita inflata TaxID=28002 RepID=A0AA86NYM8_9EUKA|nr:High cysteine membrane protein [Hexamita inflata]
MIPYNGLCRGPTDRAISLRRDYNNNQYYKCSISTALCTVNGILACYQCCPLYNKIDGVNQNCPISHICFDGQCVEAKNIDRFNSLCNSTQQCQQLKCVDSLCQQCQHGQIQNQYTCIAGQWYLGDGAQFYVNALLFGLVSAIILIINVLGIHCIIIVLRK